MEVAKVRSSPFGVGSYRKDSRLLGLWVTLVLGMPISWAATLEEPEEYASKSGYS